MYVEGKESPATLGLPAISKQALRYAVGISMVAALGGFLFGFETAVISGAEKTIQSLWQLSSGWQGFTVASSLIGTVIGSLISGMPAQSLKKNTSCRLVALKRTCLMENMASRSYMRYC